MVPKIRSKQLRTTSKFYDFFMYIMFLYLVARSEELFSYCSGGNQVHLLVKILGSVFFLIRGYC